jgi:hypothetical protein
VPLTHLRVDAEVNALVRADEQYTVLPRPNGIAATHRVASVQVRSWDAVLCYVVFRSAVFDWSGGGLGIGAAAPRGCLALRRTYATTGTMVATTKRSALSRIRWNIIWRGHSTSSSCGRAPCTWGRGRACITRGPEGGSQQSTQRRDASSSARADAERPPR